MKKILTLLASVLCLFIAYAQPANDDCNGAVTLTSQTSCSNTSGTVANATADGFSQATCDAANPSLGAGVFYKFTAVANTHTITVSPTGTLDAVVVLYSGGCFNLQQVACIDQSGGNGVVTTLTANNLQINQQYIIRVYDYGSANATSGGFSICVTHQNQNCNFTSFSSTSETHNPAAFSTTMFSDDIIMNAQAGCTYTVSESCSWLTVTNPSSSTGTANNNGQAFLNYSIQANTSTTDRVCTITVNNTPITITQRGCTYDFYPTTKSIVAGGSTYNLDVETYSPCAWSIQNSCNWVHPSQTSGTGNATTSVTIDPNTTTTARTCTLTIGNSTHIITQPGISCAPVTVSPTTASVIASGASNQTFTVNADPGCSWNLNSQNCGFVTYSPSNGTGTTTVTYSVSANTASSSRTCTLIIQGTNNKIEITQAGVPPCTYSLSPSAQNFSSSSGSGSFTVTAGSGCTWSATSNCGWVTTSSQGSGNGTVNFNVTANTGAPRTCTITVNGQTFTVTQDGIGTPCSYSITPSNGTYPATSGNGSFNVTATPDTCQWSATESCSWITLTTSTGTGNGTVSFDIDANADATRTCDISVNGQPFAVTQTGNSPCPLPTPTITNNGCALATPYYANATYEWQWNGVTQQSGPSRFFTITAITGTGYYTCIITIGSCTYPSTDIYFEYNPNSNPLCVTAIDEIVLSKLLLSPNPSSGNFTLSFETERAEEVQLKIFDAIGQLVKEEAPVKVSGAYSKQINLGNAAKGIYILQLKAGSQTINKRIEIQ